jgi:hypothetical protein
MSQIILKNGYNINAIKAPLNNCKPGPIATHGEPVGRIRRESD